MINETPIDKKGIEALIEKEFPYPDNWYNNFSHTGSIKSIIHYVAQNSQYSSVKNSRHNFIGKIFSTTLKTLWTVGLLAGSGYLIKNYGKLTPDAQIGTILATAFTVYQTKLNFLGKHIFTGAGTYYKSPYFSIFDELRFANAWRKVKKYQKQGKLPIGDRNDISTDDCYLELGRNSIGGP